MIWLYFLFMLNDIWGTVCMYEWDLIDMPCVIIFACKACLGWYLYRYLNLHRQLPLASLTICSAFCRSEMIRSALAWAVCSMTSLTSRPHWARSKSMRWTFGWTSFELCLPPSWNLPSWLCPRTGGFPTFAGLICVCLVLITRNGAFICSSQSQSQGFKNSRL